MPFDGLASYDEQSVLAESVADIVRLIAPTETPFLDMLAQAPMAAVNTFHEWTEDTLGPDRIVNSTAINSATANTGIQVNGLAALLQVGHLLEVEVDNAGQHEIMRIVSIPGPNSILVARNHGSTGVSSLAAGGNLFVIAPSAEEGADSTGDVSRAKTRRNNYTQILSKQIKVSGTRRAVETAGPTGDAMAYQTTQRTRELVRDLEKLVFRGASISSVGGDDVIRTTNGLRSYLTGINSTVTASSFTANPLLYMNNLMRAIWDTGARDIDVIAVGATWKADISATNATRVQEAQTDALIRQLKEFVQTDFVNARLILTPWLPPQALMAVSSQRVYPVPLTGRSFAREMIAKVGDADRAQVIGEYTVEVHHPDKMGQLRIA